MRQLLMQRTRQHSTRQLPVRRQVQFRPPASQAASSLMSLCKVPIADLLVCGGEPERAPAGNLNLCRAVAAHRFGGVATGV